MAVNAVQTIGQQDEAKTTPGKKGGGRAGQVIGGVIGGTAGALAGFGTAGPAGAVAGGIAGTASGEALGGVIGERISPSKQGETVMTRRLQAPGPQIVHSEQSEQLKQSLMAMQAQPQDLQQEYMAPLVKAYMQSVAQDNPNTGVA